MAQMAYKLWKKSGSKRILICPAYVTLWNLPFAGKIFSARNNGWRQTDASSSSSISFTVGNLSYSKQKAGGSKSNFENSKQNFSPLKLSTKKNEHVFQLTGGCPCQSRQRSEHCPPPRVRTDKFIHQKTSKVKTSLWLVTENHRESCRAIYFLWILIPASSWVEQMA